MFGGAKKTEGFLRYQFGGLILFWRGLFSEYYSNWNESFGGPFQVLNGSYLLFLLKQLLVLYQY